MRKVFTIFEIQLTLNANFENTVTVVKYIKRTIIKIIRGLLILNNRSSIFKGMLNLCTQIEKFPHNHIAIKNPFKKNNFYKMQ